MKRSILGITVFLFVAFLMSSCGNDSPTLSDVEYMCPMKCEGEKTYSEQTTCPVCKMKLMPAEDDSRELADENDISDQSIFNLTTKWNTQNGETIELKELKGQVLVMVMIYTTCKAACPRLVADMRNIQEDVNDPTVKFVFVSIDPETDTPEKLKAFAIENHMDGDQWVFLQGTVDNVREFSNVLSVKYKKISPLDFSHSNIISVFDKDGVLYHQQEGLGVNNVETVAKIKDLAK